MATSSAPSDEAILGRLEDLIERTQSGCWLWRGPFVDGQPDLQMGPRHIRVRRWLYARTMGPISRSQIPVPACTRQGCVAPAHTVLRGRCAGAVLSSDGGPRTPKRPAVARKP